MAVLVVIDIVFYLLFEKCSISLVLLLAECLVTASAVYVMSLTCPKDDGPADPVEERAVPDSDSGMPSVSDAKGYDIYLRAVKCMEERRPYLDDKLDLDHFSREIYSNKVYVSRNINHYSGMNFCQFVNYYRVNYAASLMERDPYLKMEEVAQMSGFHSTVSFNMAFRLFKEKTPTEWLREYLDSGHPSMSQEQEQ